MFPKPIVTLFAVFLAGLLWSSLATAEPIPDGYTQESEYTSGDLIVRAFRGPQGQEAGALQLWVFGKDSKKEDGVFLWEGSNRASVLISPDGQTVAVNHQAASIEDFLYVFVRQGAGEFRSVSVDLRKEALAAFTKQQRLKTEPKFDHFNCQAKLWLNDRYLLCSLSGYLSDGGVLEGYWLIYDMSAQRFEFDFKELNAGALQVKERR